MTIRVIVFDLGHTIWDIAPQPGALEQAYAAVRATLIERLGDVTIPSAADLQQSVHDVLHAASETYFTNSTRVDQPPSWKWIQQGFAALGLTLERDLLLEVTPPLFSTEIEGLICGEGTLEALVEMRERGYRLGCVTNTLADTTAIRAMLRKHGMESLMSSVVVSADEGWRKPHRSLFLKAMRELDVVPEESVFVGDSPMHDIGGAKAVGMFAVLTRQYVTRPTDGVDAMPDAVIDHLCELRDVVRDIDERVSVARP